jgi:DNA mismatch repair ATPase MutS
VSKLYEKYLEKKKVNSSKLYLFKNGNFYLFLGEDAELMSKELHLKLTKFSNETNKCGFPISELEKYDKFIKLLGYEYEVVLNITDQIIEEIKKINVDKITGEEAIKKLIEFQLLIEEE